MKMFKDRKYWFFVNLTFIGASAYCIFADRFTFAIISLIGILVSDVILQILKKD